MTFESFALSSGGGAIIGIIAREIIYKFSSPKNGNTPVTKHDCQVTMDALNSRLAFGDERIERIENKIDQLLMR